MIEQAEWKPLRLSPKSKTIILLGTTDATSNCYYEVAGKWDKELECFISKGGWVIAAVAWK